MNFLENKELLKNLLLQGDLLNTVNGGVVHTSVDVQQHDDKVTIMVQSPSIPGDAYNVNLNYNKLTIASIMRSEEQPQIAAPLFVRHFDVPPYVDYDAIEAIHHHDKLEVVLPLKSPQANMRRNINIRQG